MGEQAADYLFAIRPVPGRIRAIISILAFVLLDLLSNVYLVSEATRRGVLSLESSALTSAPAARRGGRKAPLGDPYDRSNGGQSADSEAPLRWDLPLKMSVKSFTSQ